MSENAPINPQAEPDVKVDKPGILIGVLVFSAFVVILNETTLNTALPVLMRDFEVSASAAQWLVTGFMLTMAVIIPMTGFILQRISMRAVFITAMAVFTAGTTLAGFAPTFAVLLLSRIIQAAGTALVMPLLMTTVVRLVPAQRRGAVMGVVSVVISVAPALGPTFSGFILGALDWRWIFHLIAPIGLLSLVIGAVLMKNFEEPRHARLDVISVIASAVGFSGLVYGLAGLSELAERFPTERMLILVSAVAVLAFFFGRQEKLRKCDGEPLLDLTPMRSKAYVVSLVFLLLTFASLFSFIILMPLFAQNVLGLSEQTTGLLSLPGGIVMGIASLFIGRAYDAVGVRKLIIPSSAFLVLAMAGFWWLADNSTIGVVEGNTVPGTLSVTAAAWTIILLTTLLNIGIAGLSTPLMSNALAAVDGRMASHAQAILNTLQQVFGAFGTTIAIATMSFFAASQGTKLAAEAGAAAADSAIQTEIAAKAAAYGVHTSFGFGAALALILLVMSIAIKFDVLRDNMDVAKAMPTQGADEQTEN